MLCITVMGARRTDKVHAVTVAAHPQARLVPVCDPLIEAMKTLAEPLGACASADATETFSTDDVDTVVTDSPTPLHAEHVLATAHTDKATLYEKPVASPVEAARALADELATLEHPLMMMGFQRRYDPSVAKAQRLATKGRIGRIEQPIIVSRDPAPPSAEYLAQLEGVSRDMTIYDFDETRFFLGEIISVNIIGQEPGPAPAGVDDFDGVVTTLRIASGAVAITKNTRHCVSGYDQKVEVFGSESKVVAENLRMTLVQVNDATGSAQQEVYLDFFLERCADAYRDELTVFIDAVSNGSPVTPAIEGDVATLVLAEAAERSARSGQTVEVTK